MAGFQNEEGEHEPLLPAAEHVGDTGSVHLEGAEYADPQVAFRLYVCGCRHGNHPS